MAQEQNEEITPLNADELDADQLEDVAGGREAAAALDSCNVNCGINW